MADLSAMRTSTGIHALMTGLLLLVGFIHQVHSQCPAPSVGSWAGTLDITTGRIVVICGADQTPAAYGATCSGLGAWEPDTTCMDVTPPATCPELGDIQHASYPEVTADNYAGTTAVTVTCDPGWQTPDPPATSFTLTCTAGVWVPEPTTATGCTVDVNECDPAGLCGPNAICVNGEGWFQCLCEPGYRWPTDTPLPTPPDTADGCEVASLAVVDCGYPADYRNAYYPEILFGDAAAATAMAINVTCEPGWQTDSGDISFTITCTDQDPNPDLWIATGSCSNDIDECAGSPAPCGDYARCVNTVGSFDCKCLDGYTWKLDEPLPDPAAPAGPYCEPTTCPEPTLADAILETTGATHEYKQVLTYSCPAGNQATFGQKASDPTKFDVVCLEDGEYRVLNLPTCEPLDCGNPGNDMHAHHASGTAISTTYLSEVQYECDVGFTIPGKTTQPNQYSKTCQADGTWTNGETCDDIDECVVVGTNCVVENSVCVNTYGSFHCECKEGFEWSGSECLPLECADVPFAASDQVTGGPSGTGPYPYSQNIIYECMSGYRLAYFMHDDLPETRIEFQCSAEKRWDMLGYPVCTKVSCGHPGSEDNAVMSPSQGFLFGDTVTYTCKDGFESTGLNPSIIRKNCGDDGNWHFDSDAGIACLDKKECEDNPCGEDIHTCIDTPGSYKCYCALGFQQVSSGKCVGIPLINIPELGPRRACDVLALLGLCAVTSCRYTAGGQPVCDCQPGQTGPLCPKDDYPDLGLILSIVALTGLLLLGMLLLFACCYLMANRQRRRVTVRPPAYPKISPAYSRGPNFLVPGGGIGKPGIGWS